jgi:molecular chaperone GrpE
MMNFKDMLKKKKTENTETSENLNEVTDQPTNGEGQENLDEIAIEELESATELVKEELALANDRYLRLYAEFDNFRRRTIKEREEARKTEGKDVIVALLPVLDDFERALKSMETSTDINSIKEGVVLIQQKLKKTLALKGLTEMESKGNVFDADIHEAITNIPAPTDDLKGKVIDEVEKGYYLNDKVIRFAKVVVGS